MAEALRFAYSIRDPIHGLIQITELESDVLRTPAVARMRWIKQMGLACLVFPGANHTRFEHSLGTMHVADVLTRKLLIDHSEHLAENNMQEIRIAALLHDVGHTPFSHVVEEFFRRFPKYIPKTEKYDHEKYTTDTIMNDVQLRNVCSKESVNLKFISRLSVGKSQTFFDSIISSPLDADKIDYIVRDSYYCGLPYGNVDLLSLSEGINLVRGNKGDTRIIFEEHSRDAAEGLLTSRFYLMKTVHLHEKNCAANLLLFRAIAEAYEEVLEAIPESVYVDTVKSLLARHMHFRWVDHDLITFLRNPETMRLSALQALRENNKTDRPMLEGIIDGITRTRIKPRSSVLLDKVLSGNTPRLCSAYSLDNFSPGTRYDLYLIFRFAAYTKYFGELQDEMRHLLNVSSRRGIYTDITFPRLPEINTLIRLKDSEKYLYDVSILMRSLVSQSATGLVLSVYSFKALKARFRRPDIEALIHSICRKIRLHTMKNARWICTDLLLLIYYYIHELGKKGDQKPREFFKGDTRFQAFCSSVLYGILPKRTNPYPILEKMRRHYGNLCKEENFYRFRQHGYPEFYSVALVQDLDLLTEIGLLYTRCGTVRIWETKEYQRRYERRISRLGREYVEKYLEKTYPFSSKIKANIAAVLRTGEPLADLGP